MANWKSCRTLEELCKMNIQWITNKIDKHPFWGNYKEGSNLLPESNMILDELIKLNELGFMTTASQPASTYTIVGYDTNYDMIYDKKNGLLQEIKQRASVEGFVHKKVAYILFNKLKNDPNIIQIFDGIEYSNREIDDINYITCGEFINGKPNFEKINYSNSFSKELDPYYYDYENCDHKEMDNIRKKIPYIFVTNSGCVNPKSWLSHAKINDFKDEIVGINLFDSRWPLDDRSKPDILNDQFWSKIIECLEYVRKSLILD